MAGGRPRGPGASARRLRLVRASGRRARRCGQRQRRGVARLLQRLPPPRRGGDDRAAGHRPSLRCPYHGWTYSLEGELKGTPDFTGVCNFDRAQWSRAARGRRVGIGSSCKPDRRAFARHFLGDDLIASVRALGLEGLHWMERRSYTFDCNWKVFVDNYLDGGYHVRICTRVSTACSTTASTRSRPASASVCSRARW